MDRKNLMGTKFLKDNFISQAKYPEYGYGQVEPNHLSAQRTAQVYAQLPAAKGIKMLEQGQFVKYDYAANENGIGEVNFTGKGEWMLVFNEIKLYREHQLDCEFALIADDYVARVYSPYDWENVEKDLKPTHFWNGKAETKPTIPVDGQEAADPEKVTKGADPYEHNYNEDPFSRLGVYQEKMMNPGTSMVPRVFKTNIGDIMTTNTINETELTVGELLAVGKNGILVKEASKLVAPAEAAPNPDPKLNVYATAVSGDMRWQVVKLYTMPDGQKGVKVMRVA